MVKYVLGFMFNPAQTKVALIRKNRPDCILKGVNCAKCAHIKQGTKKSEKSKITFINRAKLKHNNKYDYSLFTYTKAIIKSIIICPIHGKFEQNAHNHLSGKGCNKCAIILRKPYYKNNSYYNATIAKRNKKKWEKEPAYLYLIRCFNKNENFYKIGVCKESNKKKRFQSLKYLHEKIVMNKMSLYSAIMLEQSLHKKFMKFNYEPIIKFGGHNECYNMNLPKEHIEYVQNIKL